MDKFFLTSIVSLGISLAAAPALAGTIDLSDNIRNVWYEGSVSGNQVDASCFKTDNNAYTLYSVVLQIPYYPDPTAQVDLWTSDPKSGSPSVDLGTLNLNLYGSLLAEYLGNGIALAPNQQYWITLKDPTGRTYWDYAFGSAGTGAGFSPGEDYSSDGGKTWQAPGYTTSFTNPPLEMQVNVLPAPEPATVCLMIVSVVALAKRKTLRDSK